MNVLTLYLAGVIALVAGAVLFPSARRPLLVMAVFAGLVVPGTLFALLVWYLNTHDVQFG